MPLKVKGSIVTSPRLYTALGNYAKLKFNQSALPYYLLLLLVLVIAYLPLSTFYWGMKNDAFSVNFPNKFFFTQAVQGGFLPLWNPYINFGLPLYADPGFAFWNPITWFFGVVIGYTAYSLTLEVLLYVYLAGFFMFRLCKYLHFSNPVSFLTACLFMCCGFFSSHIQHINFITCAPFIPFMLHRFLQLQQQPSCRNAFFSSIAYYFILASGHPAMPIAAIYFMLLLFLLLIGSPEYRKNTHVLIAFHLLSIVFLAIEFLPAIYSYLNILPVYSRSIPINISAHLYKDTFDLKSLITLIFPFSAAARTCFFTNDPTMRNCYFSLIGIVCFCIGIFKKGPLIRGLFFAGILMFMLSLGDGIKLFLFNRLPGLSYIKTNGEFRVFGIFCFCVISAYGLKDLMDQKNKAIAFARTILKVLLIVSMACILGNLIYFGNSLGSLKNLIIFPGFSTATIKNFTNHLSFEYCLLISNIICSLLCIFLLLNRKWTTSKIVYLTLADIFINTILIVSFTSVGSTHLAQIQKSYTRCRKGIALPGLVPLNQLKEFNPDVTSLLGSYSYYDTNIGTRQMTSYPSYFQFTEDYFNSSLKDSLQSRPFIFLQKNNRNLSLPTSISVTRFLPQEIEISVNSLVADTLVILQNHYKYWRCKVNKKGTAITTAYASFMAIPIGTGINSVIFTYHDPLLLICCLVSIGFVLGYLVYYFILRRGIAGTSRFRTK